MNGPMTDLETWFDRFRRNTVGWDAEFETPYGRQPLALDTTGCLQKATTTKTRVGATWAGTVGPDGTTRDDWQAGV